MACDRVHRYRESQDVAAHDKDQENGLSGSTKFATKGPKKDFKGIGEIVNLPIWSTHVALSQTPNTYVWIRRFELAQNVPCVRCQSPQSKDHDDGRHYSYTC